MRHLKSTTRINLAKFLYFLVLQSFAGLALSAIQKTLYYINVVRIFMMYLTCFYEKDFFTSAYRAAFLYYNN